MRIVSLNANGIRSAANKGFFDWLTQQNADVVCLQETKSQEDQLGDAMFRPDGHHCFYRDASSKKGYSGVAIYARREPDEVLTELGWASSTMRAATSRRVSATSASFRCTCRRAPPATSASSSSSRRWNGSCRSSTSG